jgi:Transposase
LEPDPDQVRVVLETRHGLLVERLVEAGFVVVPVNPDLIARRRGPANKKDDVEDARIACLLALDRFQPLRPLIPHGELAAELRLLGRDDERACQDERRLLNRLRADLLAVFPAAMEIAGPDMGAPTFLRMLQRWPTATALAATSRQDLVAFARAAHSGYPERFADRVHQALGREHLTARQTLAQAKVDTIQLMVAQLLLIGAQRRTWERRMGQLLVGAPRRRGGTLPSQTERDQSQALPGKDYYDSQRDRGKDHHAALRAHGNRWLEILWHCLQRQVPYDEAVHLANRTRALHPAA